MLNDNLNHFFQTKLQRDERTTRLAFIITTILIILIIIDVVYLNLTLLKNQSDKTQTTTTATKITTSTSSPLRQGSEAQAGPTATLPLSPTFLTPPTLPTSLPAIRPVGAKDYFIPLGSGSSQAADWTDVPGVQAIVDFGQYTAIKEIHFEASVYVPTANESVSIRLFNVSDKHPVWNSDVSMEGNTTAYLTSPAIVFDEGSKLYQVQMETQLQSPANLPQARLHIILE